MSPNMPDNGLARVNSPPGPTNEQRAQIARLVFCPVDSGRVPKVYVVHPDRERDHKNEFECFQAENSVPVKPKENVHLSKISWSTSTQSFSEPDLGGTWGTCSPPLPSWEEKRFSRPFYGCFADQTTAYNF